MKLISIVALCLLILAMGCQTYQQGTPKDVDVVPIEDVAVEEGAAEETVPAAEETVPSELPEESALPDVIPVEEIPAEETPAEEAAPKDIVIIVKETDLVNLKPVAKDPDQDTLAFTYTQPLGEDGTWQTTYGDEGQYTVTITASDGELFSSRDALLIVNKKEEPPVIVEQLPEDLQQSINENMELQFRVSATDLNKDTLTYLWSLDGQTVSDADSFVYTTDFSSAGGHQVKLEVTDGTEMVSREWDVEVSNVDRAPSLEPIDDVMVRETETVSLSPQATDPDGDEITYQISDPVGDTGTWQTTYDDAGVYTVKVTATDGQLDSSREVKVTVVNVNRPPVIDDIVQIT